MSKPFKIGNRKNYYGAYQTRTGQWKRQSLGTANYEEAKVRLRELLQVAHTKKLITRAGRISPEEFFDAYLEDQRHMKREKTIAGEQSTWRKFLTIFNPVYLDEVTVQDVERWRNDQIAAGANPVSINTFLRTMKSIINHGKRIRVGDTYLVASDNPFVGVKYAPTDNEPPEVLTPEQCDQLLDAAKELGEERGDPYIFPYASILRHAGCRRMEAIGVRWEFIEKRGDGYVMEIRKHDTFKVKTKHNRSVPMRKALVEALKSIRSDEGHVLWPSKEGSGMHRYEPNSVDRALKAKLDFHWSPVISRHTWYTELLQKGVSIYDCSDWGGTSPEIIRKHYQNKQAFNSRIEL